MRLIIAGSRCATRESDFVALWSYVTAHVPVPQEIISGGAKGADQQGERLAKLCGIPLKQFLADWDTHGKRAGYLRNAEMAAYASQHPGSALIALWDGSSLGTQHMINLAKTKGLDVHIIPIQGSH